MDFTWNLVGISYGFHIKSCGISEFHMQTWWNFICNLVGISYEILLEFHMKSCWNLTWISYEILLEFHMKFMLKRIRNIYEILMSHFFIWNFNKISYEIPTGIPIESFMILMNKAIFNKSVLKKKVFFSKEKGIFFLKEKNISLKEKAIFSNWKGYLAIFSNGKGHFIYCIGKDNFSKKNTYFWKCHILKGNSNFSKGKSNFFYRKMLFFLKEKAIFQMEKADGVHHLELANKICTKSYFPDNERDCEWLWLW